jgi:hypothetical protein
MGTCPSVGGPSEDWILGEYYFDYNEAFGEIERGAFTRMDPKGIPMADYDLVFRGHPDVDRTRRYGIHYTPVTIAEYGLGAWARYRTSFRPELRDCFLGQANWFVAALRTDMGFGVWLHEFDFPIYHLVSPWVSAMAQGLGISVLVRAFQLTGDARYLEAATSAFGAFSHGVEVGGVSCEENGYMWLEEFPTDPPSHVLNGFVFALWGVLDYLRVTGSDEARQLWHDGIVTIRENLARYEMACWSRYDLLGRQIASPYYHRVHVQQLEVLAGLTGDPVFVDYHRRWRAYLNGGRLWRRWSEKKGRGLLRRIGLMPRPAFRGLSLRRPISTQD